MSLRTIDQIQAFSLLGAASDYNPNTHLYIIKDYDYEIDSVLTKDECTSIINKVGGKYFKSNYDTTVRDSKRICVIDHQLANILWKRLEDVIMKHYQNEVPFGYNVDSARKWIPTKINECFRIFKYESPSVGFKPHFDNQYCESFDCRSVLSIVIYLNDNFDGGETIIYERPDNINLKGLTIDEEIEFNGGLDSYCINETIYPTVGLCAIFPHDTLHAGTKVTKGTKIIMRTDIIYTREPSSIINPINEEYKTCQHLFNEAQNRELDGDITASSELYERSLSMRKSKSNAYQDIWHSIIRYLSLQDMGMIRKLNKLYKAYIQSYIGIYWIKAKKIYGSLSKNKYIPSLLKRTGIKCVFEYDKDAISFYNKHKEGCLRVVAMYAMILFGHSINSSTYIAQYDPERETTFECSRQWLLKCAFYELPCMGKYFHMHTSTSRGHLKSQFEYYHEIPIDEILDNKSRVVTGFSSISYELCTYCDTGKEERGYDECCCFHTGNGDVETYKMRHNNLIHDFSKNKIILTNTWTNINYWVANLANIEYKSFNHASCQCCANHDLLYQGKELKNIDIHIARMKDKIIIITEFNIFTFM